ncbi:hypothetical protein [Plasmodium yoelii yoelii]|uniref:Uncharacterized protein n=1 Tax=Plasmodium yoelii yoelii TaxID=73239 RepID=Q7RF84_PLAYO|nr:hypothetical protein [Plasmodium yoelii yoelii]
MELSVKEKKKLLENLKHRMLRIEKVIGDITFYDKNNPLKKNNSENSFDNKKNNLIEEFTQSSNQFDDFENLDEYKNNLDQIKSSLQNLSIDFYKDFFLNPFEAQIQYILIKNNKYKNN